MTKAEARQLLGIQRGDDERLIKSKFRALIHRYHPDALDEDDADTARRLIEAYRILIDNYDPEDDTVWYWKAELNPAAYCERSVFVKFRFFDDEDLPPIEVARGRYYWDPEQEEFSLFSKSILNACRELILDATEYGAHPDMKELFYLLTQEFIQPRECLKTLSEKTDVTGDKERHYFTGRIRLPQSKLYEFDELQPDDVLQIAVKDHSAQAFKYDGVLLGQLTFDEDYLYPVLLPLMSDETCEVCATVKAKNTSGRQMKDMILTVSIVLTLNSRQFSDHRKSNRTKIDQLLMGK